MTSIRWLISIGSNWRAPGLFGAALACVGLSYVPAWAAQPSCDALVRAESALDTLSYRAVVSTANPGDEQPAVTIIEAIGTDRARVFSRGVEFVMVGAATYAKPSGSDWQRLPVDLRTLAEQARPGLSQGTCETTAPVRQEVDGLTTEVYGFAVQDGERATRGTLWVGTDGLARRLEVESEVDAILFTKAVLYDYDPSISIEAP